MKFHRFLVPCLALILLTPGWSGAADPTGLEVMTAVDKLDDGQDMRATMLMVLKNKRGQERKRDVTIIRKDYEELKDNPDHFDSKSFSYFNSPKDVMGTSFLTWTYLETRKDTPECQQVKTPPPECLEVKDDDQWLYLPALRTVRRIAGKAKEDYFMGTDFTYDDLGDRKVWEDEHTLLGSEKMNGVDCWKVQSVPREEDYMYSKKIAWIKKGDWLSQKIEFYDRKGKLLKNLYFGDWKKIQDIWTVGKLLMDNKQKEHQTFITYSEVKYNTGIDDQFFSESQLRKGLAGLE